MHLFSRVFLTAAFLVVRTVGSSPQQPFNAPSKNEDVFSLDLDEPRLVQFFDSNDAQWMTQREKFRFKAMGKGFFDITNERILGPNLAPKQRLQYPHLKGATKVTKLVQSIIANLSTAEPRSNLERFSGFHTRAFFSVDGKESSEWLANRILGYVKDNIVEDDKRNITVSLIQHKFPQNSVIARIAPFNASEFDPITIVGAHCDSLNYANITGRAPGADDDGSGTVSILEALRGILVSGYVPTSPLEFHFYAGEEAGLLGSRAIVAEYEKAGKNVRAMQQMDTIAWVKEGSEEAIAVFRGFVDPDLTDFQKDLVDKYLSIPWVESEYPGTAGSDHMSWYAAGYQTCHVTESKWEYMNKNLHTPNDSITISKEFSFEHMLEYSKLAAAFAVELSDY